MGFELPLRGLRAIYLVALALGLRGDVSDVSDVKVVKVSRVPRACAVRVEFADSIVITSLTSRASRCIFFLFLLSIFLFRSLL